jgi:hypothetical protein
MIGAVYALSYYTPDQSPLLAGSGHEAPAEFLFPLPVGPKIICPTSQAVQIQANTVCDLWSRSASMQERAPDILDPLFCGVALESSPIPLKYMLKRLGVLKTNEHRSLGVPASPENREAARQGIAEIGLI